MKTILLTIVLLSVVGCAGTGSRTADTRPNPTWEWLTSTTCPGLRPEDPQLCRGETWTQIPNQPFEAQVRRARGEQW